jgi:dihydrofolate reductase
MRKIVAGFASSADGYIEGPKGEYDWIIIDKEIDFQENMKRFDALFFGRRSYEAVLAMGNKPMPGIAHYVFSNSLVTPEQPYQLIKGDIKAQVNTIKQQPGQDIAVFGGASLLASLLNEELVDEISLSIIPVLLGEGKPMVDVLTKKVWLTYLKSRVYSNGTIQIDYAVKYQAG